ncbi:MAG: hypothetical protein OMM_01805 [Candidatus Magnetoglobus multicellularis str. Araruama]|uniref:tRNA-guanine(15) transglycosylase-like domain-containing protein n=1 Tax=Candidatus Magnetoglobus multicellularis str. Araruama TaxID=890399 RepID=A0A1V1PBN7_9BACT|nr:MAG: hypothetical protein OMM_01805 [Candidatus Magnetoglobus multicellularis str. Araruama]
MQLNVNYLALGSLVPFFNRNHNLGFVGKVITDARKMCGKDIPIHVYGAGDPLELPFMAALGADIFDSSSYAHYARQGWYMTPYGAIQDEGKLQSGEYTCACPYCQSFDTPSQIFQNEILLTCHNLWLILQTIQHIRAAINTSTLNQMLDNILHQHAYWFPESALNKSWQSLVSL